MAMDKALDSGDSSQPWFVPEQRHICLEIWKGSKSSQLFAAQLRQQASHQYLRNRRGSDKKIWGYGVCIWFYEVYNDIVRALIDE